MYILSIPTYTWVFVGNALSGQPTGRAGHQCALHGSQMIVVGGVVSSNVICDQPVRPCIAVLLQLPLTPIGRRASTSMTSRPAPGKARSPPAPSTPRLLS